MAYKAPIWEDGKSPAISAENLNNLSQAVEGAQVLYGNSAPTSSTEGAVGQFYLVVVADGYGNYPLYQCVAIASGNYTWKNTAIVPAKVAAAFNLPTGSVMSDVLLAASAPRLISSYEVAGSYQWTAPDLADGKAYKIGVLAIGGGGSGGIAQTATGSSAQQATGGASGYTRAIVLEVAPGDTKSLVVGAGGNAVTGTWYTYGRPGGASSFDGTVADGGDGGQAGQSGVSDSYGGQGNSSQSNGEYGRITKDNRDCSNPSCCFNPFEGKDILGAGGAVLQNKSNGAITVFTGGKNPLTNKGGGDGVNGTVGNPATEAGCGGGAIAYADSGANRTSGAGADGAVYIYFLGVAG